LQAQTQNCLRVHDLLRQLVATKGAAATAGTIAASHCKAGGGVGEFPIRGSHAGNAVVEPGAWAEDRQPSEGQGFRTEALIERRSQLKAELASATAAAVRLRADIKGSKAASESFQKAVNESCSLELQHLGKIAAHLEQQMRSRYESLQHELQPLQRPHEEQQQQQQQQPTASTSNASTLGPWSTISPRGLRDPPDFASRADFGVAPLISAPLSPQRVAATTVVMPPSPRQGSGSLSPWRPSASSAPRGTDGRQGRRARSLPGSAPHPGNSRRAAAGAASASAAAICFEPTALPTDQTCLPLTAQPSAQLLSRRPGTPGSLSSSVASTMMDHRRVTAVSVVRPKVGCTAQHTVRAGGAPSDGLVNWQNGQATSTPAVSALGPSSAPSSPRSLTNTAMFDDASRQRSSPSQQKSSPSKLGSPSKSGTVSSAAMRCHQAAPSIVQRPPQTAAITPQILPLQQMPCAGPFSVVPLGSAPGRVGAAR